MKRLAALSLCLLALGAGHGAAAQPATPTLQPAPAAAEPDARAIILHMAAILAQARGFSFTANAAYDVTQDDGQKIEFGETRQVLLSRPGNLRIDTLDRDGRRKQITFDGKILTIFTPGSPFFASLAKPGTVDQLIAFIVDDLQTPIPLSLLLMTTLPQDLGKRMTDAGFVGEETLGGQAVEHLAARTADIDFQLWITKGDNPVPMRVVITYKTAPEMPQFSANLTDWNFAPAAEDAQFVFVPPTDARPVAVMVPTDAPPPPPHGTRK